MARESSTPIGAQIPVIQDGRRFYNDATGDELFESSVLVPDGDKERADDARAEFVAWASRTGLSYRWA